MRLSVESEKAKPLRPDPDPSLWIIENFPDEISKYIAGVFKMLESGFAKRTLVDPAPACTYPQTTIGGSCNGENNIITEAEWVIWIILIGSESF